MDQPVKKGIATTKRESLEATEAMMEKMGGTQGPSKLDIGDPPDCIAYVYFMYKEIKSGEEQGGFGPDRLTWKTLADWSFLTGYKLAPWEVDLLKRLDTCWLEEVSKAGG